MAEPTQAAARREVLWGPVAGWAGLMLLLAANFGYAHWHGAPLHLPVALLFVAGQIAIVGLFFMRLREADGLVRLASATGLIWASFLFLFTFADLLTR